MSEIEQKVFHYWRNFQISFLDTESKLISKIISKTQNFFGMKFREINSQTLISNENVSNVYNIGAKYAYIHFVFLQNLI